MSKPERITIDEVVYVREQQVDGNYVVVRTYSAGVHIGYLKRLAGKEVTLTNARRVYYWSGAATLSEMAVNGVKNPDACQFTVVVPEILLTEAIEVIPCTTKAKISLEGVKVWKA